MTYVAATDRTTIGGEGEVPGDQLQHLQQEVQHEAQHEAQQYRRAIYALIEKIRHCGDEELQELLRSIRNADSLAEATEKAVALKYC
ncbi:hypothetical protein N7539_003231 [Penicillium diatomitis]|uniref:Uncharacterized protein n=1 Tax=Penicillium diatomitis TaxID=2819901 RepID=A0A9W9XG96_9EURO|nr:uncharacterized protein N7539_003231 [Penicillium diatomitis]KAJ5491664.1 hypothetical protein N7539_003231 [Penicillium diatomitis]